MNPNLTIVGELSTGDSLQYIGEVTPIITLKGVVENCVELQGLLVESISLKGDLTLGLESEYPMYKDEYVFTPKVVEQQAKTKDKVLEKDVVINKIPSYEISNDFGTTFIIGEI